MKTTLKINPTLLALLIFSLLVDLAWCYYVGFIRDDAFITFRFARNLINGSGFVFNPGERVYGATSPGFALLMAAWLFLFPSQPASGAMAFDIAASLLSLYLLWRLTEDLPITDLQRGIALTIFIFSDKLLVHFLSGMEVPLVILCLLASFYFLSRSRPVLGGICAGLMLWFRPDSAPWLVAISIASFVYWRRSMIPFMLAAAATYAPWLIFAQLYFGTIIPQTILAKDVFYSQFLQPWPDRAKALFNWMAPFTYTRQPYFSWVTLAVSVAGLIRYRRHPLAATMGLFFVLECLTVVEFNMIYSEQRFMILSLYAIMVLFALGVTVLLSRISRNWVLAGVLAIAYAAYSYNSSSWLFEFYHRRQVYVYDKSLMDIATVLRVTDGSVIFAEPLGYIGYYSDQVMLDEVGIMSPAVTALRKENRDVFQIIQELRPEYVILHCDAVPRAPKDFEYTYLFQEDPLGYVGAKKPDWLMWDACFKVLARNDFLEQQNAQLGGNPIPIK